MKYFLKGYRALGRFLKNKKRKLSFSKIVGYESPMCAHIFGNWICLVCNRNLPNHKHLTNNGCVWCDWKYWRNK